MTTDSNGRGGGFEDFFVNATGFAPYDYQRRVASALLATSETDSAGFERRDNGPRAGKGLVISAPTGAGKTWAVLMPFIYSRVHRLPIADRLLYALPLRSLADSLYHTTRDRLRELQLDQKIPIRLQTGETSSMPDIGDPLFGEGRITFCTIDQLLSSYLGIPFSVSPRMANVNAGALVGSLIVFDEYHLLEPQGALRTALLLARHLAGVARVVWMTATQATTARDLLCKPEYLNATTVTVPPDEVGEMPGQRNKQRIWRWFDRPLSASAVADAHSVLPPGRRRTLVILNTVKRAQEIYRALKTLMPQCPVRLLHSRFLSHDRADVEAWARQSFKGGAQAEAILVATQVVEAGLDISADHLHTELAPANALVQRAGRCARYEGENGFVFVYDTIDDEGRRDYRPYWLGRRREPDEDDIGESETLRDAIDRTAVELSDKHGLALAFHDELALIDVVHTALDSEAVRGFDESEWRRKAAKAMLSTPDHRNYAQAQEMIRDIDTTSVAIADESRLSDPIGSRLAPNFAPETISVSRVSVAALSRAAAGLCPTGSWGLMAAQWDASMQRGSGFAGYAPVATVGEGFRQWLVATYQDRYVVLNPAIARYTPDAGLELGVPSVAGGWQSAGTLTNEDLKRTRRPDWSYRAEEYGTHNAWVRLHAEMLCGDVHAREKLARFWVERRAEPETFELTDHAVGLQWIDSQLALPAGTARALALLAAELHDLGKLNQAWQEVVWRWQRLKSSSRDHYPDSDEGERAYQEARALLDRVQRRTILLAHTDFHAQHRWPSGQREQEVERQFRRPGHALEGAWMAMQVVEGMIEHRGLSGEQAWQALRAAVAAVAQHHSASTGLGSVDYSRTTPRFEFDPTAANEVRRLVRSQTFDAQRLPASAADWEWFTDHMLARKLEEGGADWHWRVLESIVHRVTRLADQRGTAVGSSIVAAGRTSKVHP
ncbi:MAG: CRISPR-associated helicase Cas3' [Deltaproteobacteria bacterium]|nr:CRISPR-associated helicase Cas3' [Deltaproteobacteria bacterium]